MVRPDIIVLAASAGGVDALKGIVRILPAHLPAPLFVVLHIGPNRSVLPALLSQAGPLPASHPSHGQVIVPGHIYLAPPDRHMRLIPGFIHLDAGPKFTSRDRRPTRRRAGQQSDARGDAIGVAPREAPPLRRRMEAECYAPTYLPSRARDTRSACCGLSLRGWTPPRLIL